MYFKMWYSYIVLFKPQGVNPKFCQPVATLLTVWGPFYQHGSTLIQAWKINYVHYELWDETTYIFLITPIVQPLLFGLDK